MEEIQTKVSRVSPLSIHLYSFALRFIFLQPNVTSYVFLQTKAVNRGDKRSRRYRYRDFAKFERSCRYRDRYRSQEKKSRRGRDRYLVFARPPPPRTRARSLIANLHNNNNIVALVHTTAVATFTTTTIL